MKTYYSIGQVSKIIDVPASTLRFYDKEGLLPMMERTNSGIRRFRDEDLEWLRIIDCLKRTGMSLKEIKHFIDLVQQGDNSIAARKQMFEDRRNQVQQKIKELKDTIGVLDYKCWYYAEAEKAGSAEAVDKMDINDIPKELRKVRKYLQQVQADKKVKK